MLIAAALGCATTSHRSIAIEGKIPHFNADSLTTTSTGDKAYAVVGLVVDSLSLNGIPGATVQALFEGEKPSGAYSNSAGGFAIGLLRPGRYQLFVRRLGYAPIEVYRKAVPARIDTVVVRMQISDLTIHESWSSRDVGPCLNQTEDATDALDDYRWTDTTTDEGRIKWRTIMSLPTVPVDQITLVSDPTVCARALDSFSRLFKGDDKGKPIRAVWVIKYGSDRFVVGNPNGPHLGEWKAEVVFDGMFKMLKTAGR